MNSRERRIGIDKHALDLHVRENQKRKLLEKQEEKDEGTKYFFSFKLQLISLLT